MAPIGFNFFELGFEEVRYGLWCHFLTEEEIKKMERYMIIGVYLFYQSEFGGKII